MDWHWTVHAAGIFIHWKACEHNRVGLSLLQQPSYTWRRNGSSLWVLLQCVLGAFVHSCSHDEHIFHWQYSMCQQNYLKLVQAWQIWREWSSTGRSSANTTQLTFATLVVFSALCLSFLHLILRCIAWWSENSVAGAFSKALIKYWACVHAIA